MLWRSSAIIGVPVEATDGSVGTTSDFLFDDTDWAVRWAVIDTGTWLPGRQVLLPPTALGNPNADLRRFPVEITREKVETSPGLATDAPVSRQYESDIYEYYGWVPYWGPGLAATGMVNAMPAGVQVTPDSKPAGQAQGDPHLRSCNEVVGYYLKAADGQVGHIEELIVDDDAWIVRYVVVDTKNWLPGKKVVIAAEWFTSIDWPTRQLSIDLTRDQVTDSPEYDPTMAVDRAFEERLFRHYGSQPYWL